MYLCMYVCMYVCMYAYSYLCIIRTYTHTTDAHTHTHRILAHVPGSGPVKDFDMQAHKSAQ